MAFDTNLAAYPVEDYNKWRELSHYVDSHVLAAAGLPLGPQVTIPCVCVCVCVFYVSSFSILCVCVCMCVRVCVCLYTHTHIQVRLRMFGY